MEFVLEYGLAGVVSYGFVGLLSYILKRKGIVLESDIKLGILVAVAFGVGFIPEDLGSMILNHLKTAIAVGLALSTINTLANKAGGN